MVNQRLRRVMKLEKAENLPYFPVAVVFQWSGETPEVAWQRHLKMKPGDLLASYRVYIQVPGSRKKGEARFYNFPVVYEYDPHDIPQEAFESSKIRALYLKIMIEVRRFMEGQGKHGDDGAEQID